MKPNIGKNSKHIRKPIHILSMIQYPFVTSDYSFVELNKEWFEVSINGKVIKVQSMMPKEIME
jgi:hypothetical protein